jgi:hypothetical protein
MQEMPKAAYNVEALLQGMALAAVQFSKDN